MTTTLATPAIALRVYDDASAFHLLEQEWKELFKWHGRWNLFLSWQWFSLWWDHFGDGRQLQLLTFRSGDRLVGIAPLMIETGEDRICRLCTIGSDRTTDYMDLLVDPQYEAQVVQALAGYAAGGFDRWREVRFDSLMPASALMKDLAVLVRERGLVTSETQINTCPGLDLPASWEDYLASLSKKDRHELRRKLRRSQAAGAVSIRFLKEPDEIAASMDAFFRLHRASDPAKAAFLDDEMRSFFTDVALSFAAEGWTRLSFLELDGREVAASISFWPGDRVLLYNSGLDPDYRVHSVGIALHAAEIQEAIDHGLVYYDFLRGNEPYKYGLGGKDHPIYNLTVAPQEAAIEDEEVRG